MQEKELQELVQKIVTTGYETSHIELKTASVDCPKRLYDTLSSFSNQDDGGTIIFGINEKSRFAIEGVYDAQDLQAKIVSQCKEMEPVVRPHITITEIEGKSVVSAEISGIDIALRPCYYKGKGMFKGSYIRCGESDEPMTDYEIYSYEAFRKKYRDDIRTVSEDKPIIIDNEKLQKYVSLCKKNKPNLSKLPEEQFNELMGITKDGRYTLSSVLLFSIYPQAYYPQLSIIATSVYGSEVGELGPNGERFIDNKRIEGTIDEMLEQAIKFVVNNMRVSTRIDSKSGKRDDISEYPITAIREIILNALVHRDYSIHTEGMPIQIIMYRDRLEVINPGGLYGRISVDNLGKMQPDTRNPAIATALETLELTENRYSGIPTIRTEMLKAGLQLPKFETVRGEFKVTLYNELLKNKQGADLTQSILDFCLVPRTRLEIAEFLGVTTPTYAIKKYIKPLIESGNIGMSNPDKNNSPTQTYFTIAYG